MRNAHYDYCTHQLSNVKHEHNLKFSAVNLKMSVPAKRLYISKLPDFIKKSDLESKFAHYGKVASVEIIHRKNGVQENQPPFAFVNLETSNEEMFRCIRDFSNKKWKGEFVDVQVAKESFLSRLQREREEQKSKKQGGEERWKGQSTGEDFTSYGGGRGRGKKLYFDEGLNEEVKKESNKRKKIYFGEECEDVKEEIIENSSLLNGNRTVESSTNIVKKDPKHIEADKKRKSSNIEMRNQFRQQKLQIRSALSNLDGKAANKKIIFDENASEIPVATNEKKNKPLFDDDSESDEEMNVPSKPQFEGKEGHKLFQLQSRFHNDKRFVMNEKFLEDDHVKENENEVAKDERETQLSILEQVLGKKVATKPNEVKQKQPKAMLRFNPDDPQHRGYELEHQVEEKPSTKKKKRKEAPETTEETNKPEVSKSKFYKVADDLKNVFQTENKSFSLLATREDYEIETQEENHVEAYEIPKKTTIDFNEAFNNLTSDEEEIEEAISPPQQQEEETTKNKSASDRVRFWSEPFFFQEDDFRFQEGMDFIKRLGCQESGDFLELRRNVKEVVRAKVKNVNKKKGMFKKKLGGVKKRMKMKRALKR